MAEEVKKTKYLCVVYDDVLEELYKQFDIGYKVIEIVELEEEITTHTSLKI